MKILKVREWLALKKLAKNRSLLLENLVSITPFPNTPKGRIYYLDAKYDEGEKVTGDLPFEG